MFNYFKKLLTGYRIEKRRMDGLEFTFYYSDKPVFFNPQGMIREFKTRLVQASPQCFKLEQPIHLALKDFPSPDQSMRPNVICIGTNAGIELKVSRFSLKDGIYPMSFYRFELDGIEIGSLRRKYDYGSQIESMALGIAQLQRADLDLATGNWLWENQEGQNVYLEKFGHSQLWVFTNQDFLKI